MVLLDTSCWVKHLKKKEVKWKHFIEEADIFTHRAIIGELSLGYLNPRDEMLSLLKRLPLVQEASHEEVMAFVENYRLYGSGIGWIDAHILASCKIESIKLLTLDKKLKAVAKKLGLEITLN